MRASGILMPVFSLPGPFGIGTLGQEAFAFVDFLARAKQTYWQILPIGPTGYGDSPYQSFSAFAGNPYFIDFRALADEGWLLPGEVPAAAPVGSIDYGALYNQRPVILQKAAARLLAMRGPYTAPETASRRITAFDKGETVLLCVCPIVVQGDVEGGVLLTGRPQDAAPDTETARAVNIAAAFLAKWMEE